VFPLPPCARVPRAPKWLRGALLRQGSLVAVVDLGAFFERADSAQPQVCILIDDPELHVALAVAAVKVVEGRDTVRASEVKDYLPDPDWITESLSTPQFDFHRLDIGRVLAGLGERL
ncbi:MAG: chemotaxis protein CheW, partial [Myxococcales bacterium]|nr:chemotaxis protein CheW [Myxococcales bacterium]